MFGTRCTHVHKTQIAERPASAPTGHVHLYAMQTKTPDVRGDNRDNGRYDTIRDAILTCARKPTRVSLIYRTEPTTKKCKTEKLKSKNGYAQKLTVWGIRVISPEEERKATVGRSEKGVGITPERRSAVYARH